jgi:hypothetical protein
LPRIYPLRQLVRESFPFYLDNYLWYLKGDGDMLLVAFLGPSALAEYYVAKSLYSNVLLAWISLDKVVLERLARFAQVADAFRARIIDVHNRISEAAPACILFIVALAPNAVVVLAGTHYPHSIWPAVALLIVALIQFVAIPINRAVFVGLPGLFRLSASAIEATFVVGAVAWLAPQAGILGIALARIVGPIAGGAFGLAVLQRKLGFELSFAPLLRSLAAAAPGTVLVLLLQPRAHGSIVALADAVAAGLAWLVLFALLSYAFNRPSFEAVAAFLSRRYRAVFAR